MVKLFSKLSALSIFFVITAFAQPFPARQLVVDIEGQKAFLNGDVVWMSTYPSLVKGRTMIPLREVARVLGIPTSGTEGKVTGLRIGRLEIYPKLKLARVNGTQTTLANVGSYQNDIFYVLPRVFEQTQDAKVQFDTVQRLFTFTTVGALNPSESRLPVAKIVPSKTSFRIGEPISLIDYSYDLDGQPITRKFTGLKPVYFSAGVREVTLEVSNRDGKVGLPVTVKIIVTEEVLFSPLEYGLRYTPEGEVFDDPNVLRYPMMEQNTQTDSTPLVVSNSPEKVLTSQILYQDTINGDCRVLGYHSNGSPGPMRLLIIGTNLGTEPSLVQVNRLGETSATGMIALLGRISLMDFLLAPAQGKITVESSDSVVLYASSLMQPGHALNLMADISSTQDLSITVAMVEEGLLPTLNNERDISALIQMLPTAERESFHQRGTFPGAIRTINAKFVGDVGRIAIGDGVIDPKMEGIDALTGDPQKLAGNYGVTYKINVEGSRGMVGAVSPRGGMYAGAMSVNGLMRAVPSSGSLYRPNSPYLLFRDLVHDSVQIELVPASGSALPINLVFYRVPAIDQNLESVKR